MLVGVLEATLTVREFQAVRDKVLLLVNKDEIGFGRPKNSTKMIMNEERKRVVQDSCCARFACARCPCARLCLPIGRSS